MEKLFSSMSEHKGKGNFPISLISCTTQNKQNLKIHKDH